MVLYWIRSLVCRPSRSDRRAGLHARRRPTKTFLSFSGSTRNAGSTGISGTSRHGGGHGR